MSKNILLTKGHEVTVDDEDYDFLMKYKWFSKIQCYSKPRVSSIYACRTEENNKKKKTVAMHRVILNAPNHMDVDHINGNTLDNRKYNLRLCTPTQNNGNMRKRLSKTSSIYKGVSLIKSENKWKACIYFNKKCYYLGQFLSEAEAAIAYNLASVQHFGRFARINEIQDIINAS